MPAYQIETKNTDLVKNYQWKKEKFTVEAWIQAEEGEGSTSPSLSHRKSGFWSETVMASERRSSAQLWLIQILEKQSPRDGSSHRAAGFGETPNFPMANLWGKSFVLGPEPVLPTLIEMQ